MGLVVGGGVPVRTDLDRLVGAVVAARHLDHERLVVGQLVVADRGELRLQPAGRARRDGERVDRLLVLEELGEGEPCLDRSGQRPGGDLVLLAEQVLGQGAAWPAEGVGAFDGDGAALFGVPVVEDLAHDQRLRAGLGQIGELEVAVGVGLQLAVVEGHQAGRGGVRGVGATHHLEGEIGAGPPPPPDHVLDALAQVGAQVDGVGVVETLLGELMGRIHEQRLLEVIVERRLHRHPDPPGEILVTLEPIGLGADEGRVRDQLLRLRDRLLERLGEAVRRAPLLHHCAAFAMMFSAYHSRCLIFFSSGSVSAPFTYGSRNPTMQSVTPLSSRRLIPSRSYAS